MSQILFSIKLLKTENSKTKNYESPKKDINDIFYLSKKTIYIIDTFFTYLFSSIFFCIQTLFSKKNFFVPKMCFYSLFITLLFSFSQSQNITTELIINAYFNKSNIIHISYDQLIKSSQKKYENKYKRNNAHENAYYENNKDNYCSEEYDNNYSDRNLNDEFDTEFYLFNIIPVRRIFVTFTAFFLLYLTIKLTYISKISKIFIVNLFGMFLTYKFLSYLYSSKYYLASGFIFILFFYFFKFGFDCLYCILKFKKSDFEIFSEPLSAENMRQFWLKFTILFIGTLLSGILSLIYFNLYFNYMAFYLCLFTFIIFLLNCLEKNDFLKYKYSKSIYIFILGNINFSINKLLRKKYYNINCSYSDDLNNDSNINNNHISDINSFYFISDLFSLICFDYIDDYIEYKYQYYLYEKKKFKKIFEIHDMIFICLFIAFVIINIHGIIFKEYSSFYLAMSITKKFNSYFPIIFNYSIGRIFNHLMVLILIFAQYEISTTGDEYLINAILFIKIGRNNINIFLKFCGLFIFLLNLIYSNYLYYYSDDCHQNLYDYFKTFENFQQILQQELDNIDNDNDNEDNNSDDDDDYIDFNLNEKNNKYKIKIIANNYIKTKDNLFATDFSLCYLDLMLTIVFAVYYEYSLILKIIYLIIICFLLSRKFCLLNEIKGNIFYFIYYIISFIFSSRLIFFTCIDSNYLTFIMHLNMLALLTYYSFNNRRNIFITLIILIHLIIAYYKKTFIFFLFNFVFFVLILIFINFKDKQKFKIEKYDEQNSKLSLIFLLSLFAFFLVQLYGINNLSNLIASVYNYFMFCLNKIKSILSSKNNDDIRLIEYYIITDIIDWIDHKLQ